MSKCIASSCCQLLGLECSWMPLPSMKSSQFSPSKYRSVRDASVGEVMQLAVTATPSGLLRGM